MNLHNQKFIIRIDDRLIHGQVIVGWAKNLNLKKIIVANNALLEDKMKVQMMQLAVPSNIEVEFLTLETAVESFKKNSWSDTDSIMLLESPADAYKLVSEGCSITKINVGGLHVHGNRKQITQNLALDDEDKYYLKKLNQLNIILEGRSLPSDEEYEVDKIIEK